MLPTSFPISCVKANVHSGIGPVKTEKSFSYCCPTCLHNLLREQALKSYNICHQNMMDSVAYMLDGIWITLDEIKQLIFE